MQFLRFLVKSIIAFIKEEKALSFWVFSGMIFCSLVLLIWTKNLFEYAEATEYDLLRQNRCEFIFDNSYDDIISVADKFIADDKIYNVGISAIINDQYTLKSWYNPFDAGFSVSHGSIPEEKKDNWCIVNEKYKSEIDYFSNSILIDESIHIFSDIFCTCTGFSINDDFDILVDISTMQKILNSGNINEISQVKITYLNEAEASHVILEELNSNIIDSFHPIEVVRGEKFESYSFFEFLGDMSIVLLLVLFAIVNYTIVFSFWIEKRYETYQIYRICGLSMSKTLIMIFIEQFAFLIITHSVVSAGYFLIMNSGTFKGTLGIYSLCLQIFYTTLFLFAVNIIICILFGMKNVKNTLVSVYHGGE